MVDLDHHCAFVSNCVGKGNRRVFVLFTLFASFGCALHLFGALYAVLSPTRYQFKDARSDFCFVVSMLLSLLMTIWIGSIAGAQIAHVTQETTSYEVLKGRNGGDCCRCDRRGQANLWQFFRSGQFRVAAGVSTALGPAPLPYNGSNSAGFGRFADRRSPAIDEESAGGTKRDSTGSWGFLFGKHSNSGINHRHGNSNNSPS